MTWGCGCGPCGFTCESQCPPHQVLIQPPSFCVTVPGPILDCYNEQIGICANNPCCAPCCGGGWGGRGGWGGGWGGRGGCGGWGGW